MFFNWLTKFNPAAFTLLRIVVGLMFWQHGASKWGLLGGREVPFPELRWFAGVLEFFGGPLIAIGFLTRPIAFLLSGEMASAYFISHLPRGFRDPSIGFWPIQNEGERAVLFCFIYLFLATVGAGRWSLDGWLARKSQPR